MKTWQDYSLDERRMMVYEVSKLKNLPAVAVEKDWWVTIVLMAMTLTRYAYLMSFKGGTSLSKGWNIIERFSEDIDFSICSVTNNQLAKVRRKVRHYVVKELPYELEIVLNNLGVKDFTIEPEISRERDGVFLELRADTHPSVINVNYNSILPETSEYMLKSVKIEVSCMSMDEPVENRTMRSFISESLSDVEDMTVNFKTVVPTRTFLEKIFLLHEEFQKDHPRHKRMSRHLYDLEKIMDSPFGHSAVTDSKLYRDLVRHRSIFNNIPYVNYATHSSETIDFIPPARVIEDWRSDYNSLIENLLYTTKAAIPFDKLIERMHELKRRIQEGIK